MQPRSTLIEPRRPGVFVSLERAGTARARGGGLQSDRAYGELLRLLTCQRVPEGQRLREVEWARRLKVSRTALREALARLEAEGLVSRLPNSGYCVPDPSVSEFEEAVEVRTFLEQGAVERMCRLRLNGPETVSMLRSSCEQLERLASEGYHLGVIEADQRFHEELVEAAGNRRLSVLYRRTPWPMLLPEIASRERWRQVSLQVLADHRQIVDGLEAGNAAGACEAIRVHLGRHLGGEVPVWLREQV